MRRGVPRRLNGCGFFALNSLLADDLAVNCDIEAVMAEYHVLAYFYGWSFSELRDLPRTYRQMFCYKVKKQIEAENGKKENPLVGNNTSELISGGKPYIESSY